MLRIVLAIVSVSLTLSAVCGQIDYCDSSLCTTGVTHIACKNNGVGEFLVYNYSQIDLYTTTIDPL